VQAAIDAIVADNARRAAPMTVVTVGHRPASLAIAARSPGPPDPRNPPLLPSGSLSLPSLSLVPIVVAGVRPDVVVVVGNGRILESGPLAKLADRSTQLVSAANFSYVCFPWFHFWFVVFGV